MDVQESTMDQGQQAIRQTAELQRSFAQAALRGIESQQAAQRQAFEFTKAAIGSYVDTMNSMLPAMEDAQQQFAQEAASAGAEMTEQLQQTGQHLGQQTEQIARQSEQHRQQSQRHAEQGAQQMPATGRRTEQRTGSRSSGTGQAGSEGLQHADAPHEREIQPATGGQRGGGYQPPQRSAGLSHSPQQPSQTPSQPGPSGGQHGRSQSRPPGTAGQSSGPTDRRQSGVRGTPDRDTASERSRGSISSPRQQRQEPPQTQRPSEGSSRREIPVGSSRDPTQGSSEEPTDYGSRRNSGVESGEERGEPTE